MGVVAQIYKDYRRYRATDDSMAVTLLSQGFWASTIYRIFRPIYLHVHIPVVRTVLLLTGNMIGKLIEILTGICVPFSCTIGEGIYIGHFGNIFFPSRGSLGNNCSLSQGATLGVAGYGEERGAPVLGDRVYVGPNAIVVGKITIGEDAVICAGAVVTKSVPPRAVVLGNPARVVSYSGSFRYVLYDGMETDPDRMRSMKAAEEIGWGSAPATHPAPPVPAKDPASARAAEG